MQSALDIFAQYMQNSNYRGMMDYNLHSDNIDTYIWNEGRSREKLVKKMIRAYNKNKKKIKDSPEEKEVPQSKLRQQKLSDLKSDSGSWRGLR